MVLLSKMEGPLRIYWKNQQKMKVPVSRVANNNYSIRIQQHSTIIKSTGVLEFLLWHVTIPPIQPPSAHEYERLRIFFFSEPTHCPIPAIPPYVANENYTPWRFENYAPPFR